MQNSLRILVFISGCYILAIGLNISTLTPIQSQIAPQIPDNISLVFLPHGVRVLTIIYFGWRGILYLFPAVTIVGYLSVLAGENVFLLIGSAVVSLGSCYIGVIVTFYFYRKWRKKQKMTWREFTIAGGVSSVLNALGLSLLQHEVPSPLLFLGYFIGDTLGLIALLILLMLALRIFRTDTSR